MYTHPSIAHPSLFSCPVQVSHFLPDFSSLLSFFLFLFFFVCLVIFLFFFVFLRSLSRLRVTRHARLRGHVHQRGHTRLRGHARVMLRVRFRNPSSVFLAKTQFPFYALAQSLKRLNSIVVRRLLLLLLLLLLGDAERIMWLFNSFENNYKYLQSIV